MGRISFISVEPECFCGASVTFFGDKCADCEAAGAERNALAAVDLAALNAQRDAADGI